MLTSWIPCARGIGAAMVAVAALATQAQMVRFEVLERAPAYGGRSFDAVGP